jgi:hypothetical protein
MNLSKCSSIIAIIILLVYTNARGQTGSADYPMGTVTVNTVENGSYVSDTLGTVNTTSVLGTYGGWLEKNVGATGYFYTKQVDSVWYLVDPEGYIFITVGVTSVEEGGGINLPSALKGWGINTMGNWSEETITNFPFVPRYSFLVAFKNTNNYLKGLYNEDIFPVFDAGFETFIDTTAEDFVASYKDNPWVVGYQTDNELRFHYIDINSYLALDATDLHYKAAYNWMMDLHGYISPVSDNDVLGFRAYVAEKYMSTVNNALKKYDPNHMNLGCRIHAAVKYDTLLVKAICDNVDVNTINFYGKWEPAKADMDMWVNIGKKPFLITEFYTKAQDSGLGNADGAGWEVYTQQDRVNHFENFAMTLLSHRGSVGWTWFRYTDKNDANKGIVSDSYVVYNDLVASMANLSKDVYKLRDYLLNLPVTVSVTSVFVSPATLSLTVGDTTSLTAIVLPTTATIKSVTWSSNRNEVATVSDSGLVTAFAEGSAIITVTTRDGNKTAYCTVTVTDPISNNITPSELKSLCLYPVPVKNILSVNLPDDSFGGHYKIYTSVGNLNSEGVIEGDLINIDVSGFERGVYFINFLSETKNYASKFIKQ